MSQTGENKKVNPEKKETRAEKEAAKHAARKKEASDFYCEVLRILTENKTPFLLGGAYALRQYTGIKRETKDLDIFCKAAESPRILKLLAEHGFKIEQTDARWLAKAYKDAHFVDFIFSNASNLCVVDDTWFEHSVKGELYGIEVQLLAPEEMFWSKIYVQSRERYDGADLNHLLLKCGTRLDWKRLWARLEQHWQLLLSQFLNFQFVYPSERDVIPKWLFEELLQRAKEQYDVPPPIEKVCRGPLLDHAQYGPDIRDWDYKTITINSI